MIQWILILTLITNSGSTVTQVGPFNTAAGCRDAGEVWFNKTYPNIDKYTFSGSKPNYVCVQSNEWH